MRQISLFGVVNTSEMEAAALTVLRSGKIASGSYVGKFEAGISEITGQPNVVSIVDMTSAMFLALHLAGVRPHDEVLTTAFACMSTNSAIAHCGATPVWVDVMPKGIEIDVADLSNKISARTKAVILYHVAGYPGPAKELADLCKARGIALIEDCDNALFAIRDGLHVGSHGDFAVYSFYPNRQINCTEGGALVCKSADMAARARKLRRFGIDSETFRSPIGEINPGSDIHEIGWAYSMNNLCAAIGYSQVSTAAGRVAKARNNVSKLARQLSKIHRVEVVPHASGATPAFWVMLLFADNRDAILRNLRGQGIMVSAMHQQNNVYTGFHADVQAKLPNTDYLQRHIMAIPCGWWLENQDIDTITNAIARTAVTLDSGDRID
jgi:dTDP-4-amino-4,6-dideoxygalactose transaminase